MTRVDPARTRAGDGSCISALCVALLVVASTGCLTDGGDPVPPNNGNHEPPPPQLVAEELIRQGSGFDMVLANFTYDGSFVLSATIDRSSSRLFAFYSDDSIRSWTFDDRSASAESSWRLPNAPCPKPGIQSKSVVSLPSGGLMASCGDTIFTFNGTGQVQGSVTFGDALMGFDVAAHADQVAGALGRDSESRVEIRQVSTGSLLSSFAVGNGLNATRTVRITYSMDGEYVGIVYSADKRYIYRQDGELVRSFGGGRGAIEFAENSSDLWVTTVSGGDYGNGTILRYDSPTALSPSLNVSTRNAPWPEAGNADAIYVSPGGQEAAYISLLEEAQHYSDGNTTYGGNETAVIHLLSPAGEITRGFGAPDRTATQAAVGVVTVVLFEDGSAYAVSVERTVLSGSGMWLTYAEASCSPPSLERIDHLP